MHRQIDVVTSCGWDGALPLLPAVAGMVLYPRYQLWLGVCFTPATSCGWDCPMSCGQSPLNVAGSVLYPRYQLWRGLSNELWPIPPQCGWDCALPPLPAVAGIVQ